MRIKWAAVAVAALAFALSGCGSGDGSEQTGPARPAPKVVELGPFVGECGNVTDTEIRDVGGIGQVTRVFRNAVGCNWSSGGFGSASITFASYRGSPIERERAWVTVNGRAPEQITVAGKPGFAALDPGGSICDLAIQLGDDFFEWSTNLGSFATGNPCDRSRALAELTLQRIR